MNPQDNPGVSIITPAFNEERYVIDMIESVRGQDFESWELLFVDDGSTDRTAAIIAAESDRDPRIRLLSSGVKLGKVPAFNLAFAASRGEVIVHIGADDMAAPESLRLRYNTLKSFGDTKAVAFSKINMFKDGEEPRNSGTAIPRGPRGNRTGPGISLNRKLAEVLFPIPETLPSEDIWLGNGALHSAEAIEEITLPLVDYRVNDGNSNPRHRSFIDMNNAITARMEALAELVSCDRLDLPKTAIETLSNDYQLELHRRNRQLFSILKFREARIVDRIGVASMSHPALWRIRRHFNAHLSGWR